MGCVACCANKKGKKMCQNDCQGALGVLSPDSLKSCSPSWEDFEYERIKKRRRAKEKADAEAAAKAAKARGAASESVNPDLGDVTGNFFHTYPAPSSASSVYFARPPASPPQQLHSRTQEFTPGKLLSDMHRQTLGSSKSKMVLTQSDRCGPSTFSGTPGPSPTSSSGTPVA